MEIFSQLRCLLIVISIITVDIIEIIKLLDWLDMNEHLSADRLISLHRNHPDYVQSPTNTLQFGYGDHRYVKFTYQLLNQSDTLKQKILRTIIEDFSACANIDLSLLSSDLLSVLLKHITQTNDTIRMLATQAILSPYILQRKICMSPLGRKTIITRGCAPAFQTLIDDKLPPIRNSTYDGLIDLATYTDGIDCLLSYDHILIHLIDKLIEEKDADILGKVVILLKVLMQGEKGTPAALKTPIISRLVSLLGQRSADVRIFGLRNIRIQLFQVHQYCILQGFCVYYSVLQGSPGGYTLTLFITQFTDQSYPSQISYNVCMTLSNISFDYLGKQSIIQQGHLSTLCTYLCSPEPSFREGSSLLLCSLAQLNQGKIQIMKHTTYDSVMSLLNDSTHTCLNAVQLIANLSQYPEGKARFIQAISILKTINKIDKKYIDATVDVLEWQP